MQIVIVWAGTGGIVEGKALWCGLIADPITSIQVPFFFFFFFLLCPGASTGPL